MTRFKSFAGRTIAGGSYVLNADMHGVHFGESFGKPPSERLFRFSRAKVGHQLEAFGIAVSRIAKLRSVVRIKFGVRRFVFALRQIMESVMIPAPFRIFVVELFVNR